MKHKKLIVGITAEGSVSLLEGQLAYFKSLGYETYLLAPLSKRSEAFCIKENCKHLVIDIDREINPIKDFKTFLSIIKIFKEVNPDIINLGTPKVSLLGMIAGFYVGVKQRIYTCRGFRFENETGIKRLILVSMEKVTAFFAHKIICISPSLKKYAVDKGIFNKEKTLVINKGSSNGLDLAKFSVDKIDLIKQNEFINQHKLHNKFIFGFVGRLVKDKGLFDLLNVFDKLYSDNKDARLLILGSDITSNETEKSVVKEYKDHPAIVFLNFQTDVSFYMSMFNVMVLPSHREGFGNVYIQAASMGVPCIGYDITGVKDAVSHGFNGLLVQPKSEIHLYEAMKTLYLEKDLSNQLGQNGLIWAQNFDRQIIWQELHNIYQS